MTTTVYENLESITPGRVRTLLDYDKKTGQLKWKMKRARTVAPDMLAGTVDKRSGHIMVTLFGQKIPAQRLIYFMLNDVWPDSKLICLNGDQTDLHATNWRLQSRLRDPSEAAANARARSKRWRDKRRAKTPEAFNKRAQDAIARLATKRRADAELDAHRTGDALVARRTRRTYEEE